MSAHLWLSSKNRMDHFLFSQVRSRVKSASEATTSSTSSSSAPQPLEESAVLTLTKKKPVSETAHEIPHRFHRQTNMKRDRRCPVCAASLPLCRAVSACKFCNKVVHIGCEEGVGE